MTSKSTIPTNYSAKVHTLIITNIDGSNACDVSIGLYNSNTNNVWYAGAAGVSVPADSSLVVISNDTAIWLDEGDSLQGFASANSDLNFTCSFTLFAD